MDNELIKTLKSHLPGAYILCQSSNSVDLILAANELTASIKVKGKKFRLDIKIKTSSVTARSKTVCVNSGIVDSFDSACLYIKGYLLAIEATIAKTLGEK